MTKENLNLLREVLTGAIYPESSWELLHARKTPFRNPVMILQTFLALLRKALKGEPLELASPMLEWIAWSANKQGFALVKKRSLSGESIEEGKEWPLVGYTMVGSKRLDNVRECIQEIIGDRIAGDFVETGVWRGGTCIWMKAILEAYGDRERTVWVADSFQGLPKPQNATDGADLSWCDYLAVSLENVSGNFQRFGLLDHRVRFLPGWFADTLHAAPIKQIALLRLDGDLYSSTMDALKALYHKVTPGGFVIVDDYYSWPECRAAVADFCREANVAPQIKQIDWTAAFWRVGSDA